MKRGIGEKMVDILRPSSSSEAPKATGLQGKGGVRRCRDRTWGHWESNRMEVWGVKRFRELRSRVRGEMRRRKREAREAICEVKAQIN